MYAGCVACCLIVSHVQYAPRALLTVEKKMGQTDRRTDGRQIITLRLPLDAASVIKDVVLKIFKMLCDWLRIANHSQMF